MLKGRGCTHLMPDGRLCRSPALRGENFCLFHSSGREDEVAEIRRLGGLRRRKERTVAGAYEFEGLSTVPDIRRLLEVAALDTLSLENSVARARTLAYLAQTALKCLEVGDLEERVHALEAALASRDAPTPDFDLELDIDEDQPQELNP
jgi:hypothetical protein